MDKIAETKSICILGVKIDALTKSEALSTVSDFLSDGKQHAIFTPNPEMLMAAYRDSHLREVLSSGSLNICDGKGIEIVLKKEKGNRKKGMERIAGIDLMLDICRLAEEQGRTVYLLGSGDAVIIKCAVKNLQQMFPKLTIAGCQHGPKIIAHGSLIIFQNEDENPAVIAHIRSKAPDIVFVAFGHGKQEKWIHEHLAQLPSVKIAMGVGGAFDILGGKLKRAPKWMQKIGLEWLWRLILEPRRIRRIWTAVVVFPILVFLNRTRSDR